MSDYGLTGWCGLAVGWSGIDGRKGSRADSGDGPSSSRVDRLDFVRNRLSSAMKKLPPTSMMLVD